MELSKNFLKGMEENGYTLEYINKCKYIGGNKGRHYNYYNLLYPFRPLPILKDRCVCGMLIKENCFIEDEDGEIIIIGNECINKFCKISYRSCGNCGVKHQNRKDNYCNDCRIKLKCPICNTIKKIQYNICYNCFEYNKLHNLSNNTIPKGKCIIDINKMD